MQLSFQKKQKEKKEKEKKYTVVHVGEVKYRRHCQTYGAFRFLPLPGDQPEFIPENNIYFTYIKVLHVYKKKIGLKIT